MVTEKRGSVENIDAAMKSEHLAKLIKQYSHLGDNPPWQLVVRGRGGAQQGAARSEVEERSHSSEERSRSNEEGRREAEIPRRSNPEPRRHIECECLYAQGRILSASIITPRKTI